MLYNEWLKQQLLQQADENYLPSIMPSSAVSRPSEQLQDTAYFMKLWRDFYRTHGHLHTTLSTLDDLSDLWHRLQHWHDSMAVLETSIGPCSQDMTDHLSSIYCASIGYELDGMRSVQKKMWMYAYIEAMHDISQARIDQAHAQWMHSYALDYYLNSQYAGQKRFSLEGLEALIPALKSIIYQYREQGITYIAIGMAHRGRLNVMANVLGMPWQIIKDMCAGTWHVPFIDDVKYHVGCSYMAGDTQIELVPNASHVESVGAIVLGAVRAKQAVGCKAAAIVVHGDAAFPGQGVVTECLNMRLLPDYAVGGVIHIIANNQIGFTTTPEYERSTMYATDSARGMECPILHINGTDIAAVLRGVDTAVAYRTAYAEDIILDIYGVRVQGHNEGDDASITSPRMVAQIKSEKKTVDHATINTIIEQELAIEDPVSDDRFKLSRHVVPMAYTTSLAMLQQLWQDMITPLATMALHRVVRTVYEQRTAMIEDRAPVNWAAAEMYALMRVLDAGGYIRMMGEDTVRGTFTQRLADVIDQVTEQSMNIYAIDAWKDRVVIGNSPLSEYAALAFEYGYACRSPMGLTIWEAQYGDFFNGAQIIIDQYIASGQHKWGIKSNLVLLLPHGDEGQGAEHSSARVERFLQLSAQYNMHVVMPSTPMQYHHALLAAGNSDCPWIIMTVKSLLRHPLCVSKIEDMLLGSWQDCIVRGDLSTCHLIIIASGLILYDIQQDPRFSKDNIVLICLESLYPFPQQVIEDIVASSPTGVRCVYAQLEPMNQGALGYVKNSIGDRIEYIAPEAAAVTASIIYYTKKRKDVFDRIFGSI